jgi:hypothetical protein
MSGKKTQEIEMFEKKVEEIITGVANQYSIYNAANPDIDLEINLDLSELPVLFLTKAVERLRSLGYAVTQPVHPLYHAKITVRQKRDSK